jgi:hypothetical protein
MKTGESQGGMEVYDQGQATAIDLLRRMDNVGVFVSVINEHGVIDSLALAWTPHNDEQRTWMHNWFDRVAEVVEEKRHELLGGGDE